jgi:hypothetical protein
LLDTPTEGSYTLNNRPVAELPTIWLERAQGTSNFKVARWIPRYLKWYRFAFGPPLPLERVAISAAAGGEMAE